MTFSVQLLSQVFTGIDFLEKSNRSPLFEHYMSYMLRTVSIFDCHMEVSNISLCTASRQSLKHLTVHCFKTKASSKQRQEGQQFRDLGDFLLFLPTVSSTWASVCRVFIVISECGTSMASLVLCVFCAISTSKFLSVSNCHAHKICDLKCKDCEGNEEVNDCLPLGQKAQNSDGNRSYEQSAPRF